MLNAIGPKISPDLTDGMGTTVTSKAEPIRWLKRSLAAVKGARAAETPADLQRKTKIFNIDTAVDGIPQQHQQCEAAAVAGKTRTATG